MEQELLFSCLDAWNGYHSIPLEDSAKNFFGFLTEYGTYMYNLAPQGFLGSGYHYVAQYNAIMGKLLKEEQKNPESVFKCFSDKSKGTEWSMPSWRRCIDNTLIWSSSIKDSFLQCAQYLNFCGREGIIFNPKKLEVGKKQVNIFGFRMSQNGVLPSENQVESLSKYPAPKNLRDMRGFMGLVNQSTFCLSSNSRKLMEELKGTLKSTRAWAWTTQNETSFEKLKKNIVTDCEKGIKRLTSHGETPLVVISDWSKSGSGFTLYEVTCEHPKSWDVVKSDVKTLCCPENWRMIMAGGRFNSETEAGYAPIEGELLGIASALHKSRYFISGHPDVTVITDHKPILNLLQDRTRTINNRLTNLRRKCDGFIFQTGYGRGIDNTTDAISRIKGWSKKDPERLESVEDSKDIDDDSTEVNATEIINKTDLEEVIMEINFLNLNDKFEKHNASSAILGSWYSTPKQYRIQTLTRMYGNGGWDKDNQAFSSSIQEMDSDRDRHYQSKLDVTNDFDNIYSDQHQICADNGLDHASEAEWRLKESPVECFVLNINKRKYYALSWEEIADAAEEDEFLVKLKEAIKNDNDSVITELLKGKVIHCKSNKNGISSIKKKDLSLYRDTIMVRDRIWAPESLTAAFFNNLHLGHRSVDIMHRMALRSVYWTGMTADLTDLFNECQHCNHIMDKNKKLPDLPEEETTRKCECISMDGFHTDGGENGLAVIDRHTGYVWARKTGNIKTGTANVIMDILIDIFGAALYSVKKFKTDNGKNLIGGIIEDISKELKIWQDTSSAYHPAGNKCIENAVGRIKNVIGDKKIEDCKMEIEALNLSQPYSNKTLTPFEELYGSVSPVNGIPMTEEAEKDLIDMKYTTDKLQRSDVRNSNPTLKPFSKEDRHQPTKKENEMSSDWVEKVNGSYNANLTCGDRVYYIDHQASASERWRKAIVLQRKKDYIPM